MHYIPIEQMRDKYLVGVVSIPRVRFASLLRWCMLVQLEAREHARCQEFCHGSLCEFNYISACSSSLTVLQATHKDGKDAGIELVQPPAGSKVGERIYFEGFEGEFQVFFQLRPGNRREHATCRQGGSFTTQPQKEDIRDYPARLHDTRLARSSLGGPRQEERAQDPHERRCMPRT